MDPKAERELNRILEFGEALIWAGVPRQGLLLRPVDAALIPFSLLWGGFAIFWEVSAILGDAPIAFALWGVPFVVLGLYLIIGRFVIDARARARTYYGLTNRRAIIVSGIMSRSTRSMPLRLLSDVSVRERANGTGTVLLGKPDPFAGWFSGLPWPGMDQYSTPAFELIPDAKRVYDQVLEAQRVAAEPAVRPS